MKSIIILLSFIGLINAQFLVQQDQLTVPASCDASTISCHWKEPVDSCCSPKYGLVVLALQWAPGYGPSDEFTIHGLWPDTCAGKYAPGNGCDSSRRSNQISSIIKNMNETLYNRMNTFWPSNKGDNNWFWSHEWTKHGTCVSTIRPTCYGESYVKYQDVIEYFQQVLDLRDKWDLYGALNLKGVSPGRYYNVETFRDAIKSAFGASPKLDCVRGRINEISLNFYVKGRTDYLITDVLQRGNCRGAVYYPRK